MSASRKVRILSIDGGGMRGVIPGTIAVYIEQKLQEKTGDPTKRLADYFDMVAGTSTGGILACLYLLPDDEGKVRFEAADALNFYLEHGESIFNDSRNLSSYFGILGAVWNATKFDKSTIEDLFSEKFENKMFSDLLKPCLVTTYDLKQKRAFFFNSREEEAKKRAFFIKDVVRSTSAAPTYFEPAVIQNQHPNATQKEMYNIDGGVFANNPSMCAYAEARSMDFPELGIFKPHASQMQILSLGTGGGNFKLPDLKKSRRWGVTKWAQSLPNIMMNGATDTVAYQVNEIFQSLPKEDSKDFLRIDVPKESRKFDADMSNASKDNIVNLQKAGEAALRKGIEDGLDAFIDRLIG